MALAALLATGVAHAREIFVDFEKGDDKAQGAKESPLKGFPKALEKAEAGDSVILLPASKPVNCSLRAINKKGAPGKPIVVDGSFNVLDGSRRVEAKDWEEVSPSLFMNKRKSPGDAMLLRYFMRFDGVMQRMGRHTKYGKNSFKAVEELKPCEWTIVDGTSFYFKLPAGKGLQDVVVEEPAFDSGVQLAGTCESLVFKNIITTHFWNDGFNFHGHCKDIYLENVAAIENADDGISAHEDCQFRVKNMLSIRNSTGICHIEQADCEHENVYIYDCDSRDILVNFNVNLFKNVVVEGDAAGSLEIDNPKNKIEGCVFSNLRPGNFIKVNKDVAVSDSVYCGYKPKGGAALPEALKEVQPGEVSGEIAKRRDALFAVFGGKLDAWKPGTAKAP